MRSKRNGEVVNRFAVMNHVELIVEHFFPTFSGDYNERCLENELTERCSLQNSENNGDNNCSEYSNYNNCSEDSECQNQYHDNDYSNQYYNEDDGGGGECQQQQISYQEQKGPEILYKSSKQLYKAVAKQCGITCKMTDTCR